MTPQSILLNGRRYVRARSFESEDVPKKFFISFHLNPAKQERFDQTIKQLSRFDLDGRRAASSDTISFKEARGRYHGGPFKAFHISGKQTKVLLLNPKVPSSPFTDKFGNAIEDCITPRVCVAPGIEQAIVAIKGTGERYNPEMASWFDTDSGYLYGIRAGSKLVQLNKHCPTGYGPTFTLERIQQSNVGGECETRFKFCVPDAHLTGEMWSLIPLRAYYIGQIVAHDEVLIDEP